MVIPRSTPLDPTSTAPASQPSTPAIAGAPAKRFATKEEVCHEFGISLNTLTEWMKDGTVPFLRYGRRVYFEWPHLLAAGRSHAQPAQDK